MNSVGHLAADLAGVGLDRAPLQAHAVAHARIRPARLVVGLLQRLLRGMEAVGVLHHELAAAHEAEARTDLVAELHLRLVQVHGQLFVAAQLVAHDGGDELLVRGPEAVLDAMAVGHAHELGTVVVPAARLVPELGGLHEGHKYLLGTDGVHLLVDDGLDLVQHAHTQRQEAVQAGGVLRIMPARSSRRWLASSASAGSLLERGCVQNAHLDGLHR